MINKINNTIATLMLTGILLAVTGILQEVEQLSYFDALLAFAPIVALAMLIKNLIGWLGVEFNIKFLPYIHYSRSGIVFELILFFALILILPLTGDAGA